VRFGSKGSRRLVLGLIALAIACSTDISGPAVSAPSPFTVSWFKYCLTFNSTGAAVSRTSYYTCTTTNTFSPYYYHSSSLGQMAMITYTFSRPVVDLDILAEGGPPGPENAQYVCDNPDTYPTYAAYGPTGALLRRGSFSPTGLCPSDRQAQLGLEDLGQILRVEITAPVSVGSIGYTATYRMEFNEPCPPTADSVLDDPGLRRDLLDQLSRARPNADGTGKKEYGGYVYQRDDGTYFLQPANDLTATDCGFTIPGGSPPTIAGAHYAGRFWHVHPSLNGERLYGCSWAIPGDIVTADRDPKNGGGSTADWNAVEESHTPQYIIDQEKVWRLDPDTSEEERGNNPNKWTYNQLGCFTHA
jgi:hypothetical protein